MQLRCAMDLGGLGILPGFRNREFKDGNRFLLFNFRYLFSGDLLRRLPFSFIPFYDALSLSLFIDSGWLHFEEDDDLQSFFSFDKLQFDKLKTDVGFSFSVSEDMFLINFAKRTDFADDAWQVTCRLMYTFWCLFICIGISKLFFFSIDISLPYVKAKSRLVGLRLRKVKGVG